MTFLVPVATRPDYKTEGWNRAYKHGLRWGARTFFDEVTAQLTTMTAALLSNEARAEISLWLGQVEILYDVKSTRRKRKARDLRDPFVIGWVTARRLLIDGLRDLATNLGEGFSSRGIEVMTSFLEEMLWELPGESYSLHSGFEGKDVMASTARVNPLSADEADEELVLA